LLRLRVCATICWYYDKGLTRTIGLNIFLVFVPFSWIAHLTGNNDDAADGWNQKLTFACMYPSKRLKLI
jgi:hypothetical protein